MKYAAHFYPGFGLASALQRWVCDVLAVAYARWRFKIRWEKVQSCEPEAEAFNVHQALRLALAQSGIHLKFEPWSRLNAEGVLGMAVVVCWPQPDGRVLQRSAAEFVEEASQEGLCLPLADWVLETACQQAAQWQSAYGPLVLALGISKQQLQDPHFFNQVRSLCEAVQFPYQSLVFEVNAHEVAQDFTQSMANIQMLIGQGLRLTVAEPPAAA